MDNDIAYSPNDSRNNSGFSLLEVVVALAIFAIGILAVGSMQLTAIKGNSSADVHTEAVTVATDQMERWMALPYEGTNSTVTINQPYYEIVRRVDKEEVIPNTESVTIHVDRTSGAEREVTLECIKADTI